MNPENEVLHKFYEKPTKNSRVILASSALSWSQKRTILTQEALRRIRNTSPSLGDQVVNNHLSDFMLKLKESGYNAKFRREIILSAKNAYKILVQKSNLSTQPLFRTRAQMLEDKKFKGKNATNWWKSKPNCKKPFTSILFVPPTPNGELASLMKKRERMLNENSNMNIKIVEKSGVKVKRFLVQADPFLKTNCDSVKCPFCQAQPQLETNRKMKTHCKTPNVGYRIECKSCGATYEGETARLVKSRAIEHVNDLEKKKTSSPLIKHMHTHHPQEGGTTKFELSVTGKFRDALTRQADESVRIRNSAKASEKFMNAKSEFNAAPIRRLALVKTHAHIQ